ncbi:hypothetical protein ACFWWS_38245, partial [Streptomyces sp. NPDC059083]|uniref:hypothetical protein n=1 Tax=Streptomyces sp. NPDC059083 TaxID=3346721 RepID=UPI0036D0DA5F
MTEPQTSNEPQSLEELVEANVQSLDELIEENMRLRAQLDVAGATIAILDTVGTRFQAINAELTKQVAGLKARISQLTRQRNQLRESAKANGGE